MFVERDETGKVKGLYANPQHGYAEEFLLDDDADVLEYLSPPVDRIALITAAVKALPVAKRANAAWGGLISQCLLAYQNEDLEALGYLLDNFQTADKAYSTIIAQAKQLFGLS